MDDVALTPAERALLVALNARGVRCLVVGLGPAVLQGAPVSTQDIDLWFEHPGDHAMRGGLAEAGRFWIAPFGLQPPAVGGDGLERVDTVLTAHGLEACHRVRPRTDRRRGRHHHQGAVPEAGHCPQAV